MKRQLLELPEQSEYHRTSVTLPADVWASVDAKLTAVNKGRQSPDRLTRDTLLAALVRAGLRVSEG
jgi:hypothetical protein